MDLFSICAIAFVSVFALLAFLALTMYFTTLAFPAAKEAVDPAIVAAISSAVAAILPGARVTKIEEEP